MDKIFYHTFLLYCIKREYRQEILEISKIKEIICRFTSRTGGFPKRFVRYIIEDMVNLKLIERINSEKYRVLCCPLESKIKALMMACY